MNLKLSKYHVVTNPFLAKDNSTKSVIYSTRTARIRLLNDISWQMIISEEYENLPKELLNSLIEMELLVEKNEDELATVISRHRDATKDDTLSFVVQPTAFCQLGCDYCGQQHLAKWLNPRHQDQLVTRLSNKLSVGGFSKLKIGWFGSEPLSGINVMRLLSPRFIAIAEEYNCIYGSSIVTNGVGLSESVSLELIDVHKVTSINITIDGTREYHDARRHYKGTERPTFNRIFENLKNLVKVAPAELEIKVRTNVDRRNYEGVLPLIHMIADARLQHRINHYAVPVHSWGNSAHDRALPQDEFAEREIEWFVEMAKLGFRVGLIPPLQPVVCMAVTPHSELVDAHGNLFNCTEVSYVPKFGDTNIYKTGHLSGCEAPENRKIFGDFNIRVLNGEFPCTNCRMLPVCGGSCPKAWLENHIPCPSAKNNIEKRLVLHYALNLMRAEIAPLKTTKVGYETEINRPREN